MCSATGTEPRAAGRVCDATPRIHGLKPARSADDPQMNSTLSRRSRAPRDARPIASPGAIVNRDKEDVMKKILTGTFAAMLALSSAAFAQTPPAAPPAGPSTGPSASPSVSPPSGGPAGEAATLDPAAEARFKALDKNASGTLDGAETDAMKASMGQIDTDKDGKVSRAEFGAAVKSGLIR
jgi:hypothetical protein